MTVASRRATRSACGIAALVATSLLHPAAQTPPAREGSRVLAQPVAPPAIDRGVIDDAVAEARRTGGRSLRQRTADMPYEPGRVIVKFRDGGSTAARTRAAADVGARASAQPAWADFDILEIDPAADPEAVAATLSGRDDVEYAQACYRAHPLYRPNDPLYDRQWNFRSIGMEQAWDINRGASSAVVVAVLDTGVAYKDAIYEFTGYAFRDGLLFYPALGRVTVPFAAAPELGGPSRFVSPRDFIWLDDSPVDLDGHGTHVSGTIGQITDNGVGLAGMAFNVRLMPVKVVATDWDDIFHSPRLGTDDDLAQGIRYAADNGAKVINMSLGRDGSTAPVVGAAIRYAVSRGAIVVVAAGNSFEDGNPPQAYAVEAAPIDGAIVVAAVGPDLQRAYYSSTGSFVEIAAPGGNARSGGAAGAVYQQTYDPAFTDTFLLPPSRYGPPRFDVFIYRPIQGTSMAAPHVSGLAALLISQGITSPAAIEAAMKRFALERGPVGRDNEYGAGLIDPRATLRGLGLLK